MLPAHVSIELALCEKTTSSIMRIWTGAERLRSPVGLAMRLMPKSFIRVGQQLALEESGMDRHSPPIWNFEIAFCLSDVKCRFGQPGR